MRLLTPFLFVLYFCIFTSPVYADVSKLDEGHIGIDIAVAENSKSLVVEYVAAKSPAAIAGIKVGDTLTAINGVPTQGLSLGTAQNSIRGTIGSVVRLSISHQGSTDENVLVARRSLLDAYMPAAMIGDARAEYDVGTFYEGGPIASRNLGMAVNWYRKAADQGYGVAEVRLGNMYGNGLGVTKDEIAAIAWELKAAKQGLASAERILGLCYLDGIGVAQSDRDAFAWFYSAAKQDDPIAEENLAHLYLHGLGVARNDRDAFNWYYRSAQNNNPIGAAELGYLYLEGIGVAQSDRDAFAWSCAAANQDDPGGEEFLAHLYLHGRGVVRNDRDAFNWYYRSAQNSNAHGAWGLAHMYSMGLGVKANTSEALKWYKIAAAAFPEDQTLKKTVARISVKEFLENHDFRSLDVTWIMAAFQRPIFIGFIALTLAYLVVGTLLLYFSFKGPDAAPKLSTAIGWITFYVESQGVALLAIFVFGKNITAATLFLATSLFSALPVLASTIGSRRGRIWKGSPISWKQLSLYGAVACLAVFAIGFGYEKSYAVITGKSLPPQSTFVLVGKAKFELVWAAYACIGCILPAAEEIIFRYYLFDALRRRFSGKIVVVITALAFSLVHFQRLYFLPLFGFGFVLGWVRLKTGSLRLPILLHGFNNCLFLAFAV